MKLTSTFVILAGIAIQAPAQTTASRPVVHHTPGAAPACVKIPELSPKIPALAAGLPCPHSLYTVTTVPTVKLDYTSPLEPKDLAEELGITTSTFSLAYVDTRPGTGALPEFHKWLTIHYTGYLVDGTKFDSSLDRGEPIDVPYGEHHVIPGWDTGFAGMRVGGKRRLYIPYQLAYGPQQHQTIPPKSMLIFDVELLAVNATQPPPRTPPAPPAAAKQPDGTSPHRLPSKIDEVKPEKPVPPTTPPPATTEPAKPTTAPPPPPPSY